MGFISNLKSDWATVSGYRRLMAYTADISPDSENLVADDIERSVDRHRNNVFCRFEGTITTYGELEDRANRVAQWALSQDLKAGDAVAVFLENSPDYLATWFGLSKIGIVAALINHNLADKALAHCVNIADAKAVICSGAQTDTVLQASNLLENAPAIWSFSPAPAPAQDLEAALSQTVAERPDRSHRANLRGSDLCLYVYTSGTTGLPKAARMTQSRTQGMMRSFVPPTRCTARDRLYITLPLYHSTGGLCGVGTAMMTGASIILRRRFSASRFWDDATDEGATVIVYIGELCRYLVNQPPHPKERAHNIRTGFGNGLRPEIWETFLERFNIPKLSEFYGSTEGNVSFLNFDGKVGAVGHIPKLLESRVAHIKFVKFDIESEMPVRNKAGFCIEAAPNEAAEVIGKVGDDARSRFEGYNDPEATKKKLLQDVFEPGDLWFRTGDLMRKDERGHIYFVDRIGDTFRWKGENVSTNEVGEVLSNHDAIEHANIYGVPIAGMDGKAGMAAVTLSGELAFEDLYDWLKSRLPTYAIPLFVRVQKEAETTGTFKYRKVDLVKEGFDPSAAGEPIWFLEPGQKRYKPLTANDHETILSGGYRF